MTNEIIHTLNCFIDSIQLKLSDFGLEKPDFGKILINRFQSVETPQNVNQTLNLLADNHLGYVNPICPVCGSNNLNKQEFQERNPILGEYGSVKIYLRRHLCKNCNKKFVTSLNSIIKPHHRHANTYTNKLESLLQTGYRSLRKLGEDFQTFFGNSPSHQSIKKLANHRNRKQNNKLYTNLFWIFTVMTNNI